MWLELLQRVHAGATLYLSHDDCLLSPVNQPFGIEIQTRQRCNHPVEMLLDGIEPGLRLRVNPPFRLVLQATRSSILGREAGGNPAMTCASYGKGTIYFLSAPIEMELTRTPGAFHSIDAQPFWKIYHHIAESFVQDRAVGKVNAPLIGITEHPLEPGRRVAILINYSPEKREVNLTLSGNWKISETWYGDSPTTNQEGQIVTIPRNDAAVFTIERKEA
jgi:hypothetical protein